METKGNRFFGATSILMILGGAAGIVGGVIAVLGAGVLAAALGDAASFGLLMLSSIVVWASGVAGLVAGVIGVQNAAKPGKVMACIVFGALTAALSVLGNILAVAGGGSFSVGSIITGMLFPVLYLIGAFQSKSADTNT